MGEDDDGGEDKEALYFFNQLDVGDGNRMTTFLPRPMFSLAFSKIKGTYPARCGGRDAHQDDCPKLPFIVDVSSTLMRHLIISTEIMHQLDLILKDSDGAVAQSYLLLGRIKRQEKATSRLPTRP
jgi:hypothetical protein